MNTYLIIAGILCILLGIVHSFLGEFLIFRHKRNKGSIVPSKKGVDLRERHLRIIWASWHLASVFGWSIGAIIIKLSLVQNEINTEIFNFVIQTTAYSMFLASLLVLTGTKGKHPGWIVLLLIGILLAIS